MHNILVCDDDRDIVAALKIYLSGGEYRVFEAYNGAEAVEAVRKNDIHLVLMDIMMPKLDGFSACKEIKKIKDIPVIMVTAKGAEYDKVMGLDAGADDYVTKPFNPVELQARVKSQLRRYMQLGGNHTVFSDKDGLITIGPIVLNDRAKEVTLDGELVNLTRTECDILHLLMLHPGKVFSPAQIYEQVWKEDAFGTENTVAVHIRHLREKLEYNPAEPRYVKVVWGRGYKVEDK